MAAAAVGAKGVRFKLTAPSLMVDALLRERVSCEKAAGTRRAEGGAAGGTACGKSRLWKSGFELYVSSTSPWPEPHCCKPRTVPPTRKEGRQVGRQAKKDELRKLPRGQATSGPWSPTQ